MSDDQVRELRAQAVQDRKLLQRAADALAELDRVQGLEDHHADVLAALRIRIEGRKRSSLDDLLTTTGEISGKRDIAAAIDAVPEKKSEWPTVEDSRKDWPGL